MTVELNKKRRRIYAKDEERKGTYTQDYLSNMFPNDIMLDILSRLPVKSLMRFRSVSRSWNYLIRKDQFFINMHLSRSQIQLVDHEKLIITNGECNSSLYLLDYNQGLYSLDYNQGSNRLERLIHHNSRLKHVHTGFDHIWGICNGLICIGDDCEPFFIDSIDYCESTLYILNPSTTEYKKVPWLKGDDEFRLFSYYSHCYGFGYNPNANDYIVLKLTKRRSSRSDVAIYSLRSNSWKTIKKIPYRVDTPCRGQLVNGSLHWVMISSSSEENALIAFEIATENFLEVPCPDDVDHDGVMLVGQYQGKLCFYHDKGTNLSFDLWVMNKYKVKESWTKVFNIRNPFDYCSPSSLWSILCLTKDGCIVMNTDDKQHLILYDPKRRTRRYILGINTWGEVNSYVPSIVTLNFNDA